MAEVKVTRLGFSADGRVLRYEAKSPATDPDKRLHLRLFDGDRAEDLPLTWVNRTPEGDRFVGATPVEVLADAGFNLANLGATGQLHLYAEADPLWEGRDHRVLPHRHDHRERIKGVLTGAPVIGQGGGQWTGFIELTVWRELPVQAGPSQVGKAHLTHVLWRGDGALTAHRPERVELSIFPVLEQIDGRGRVSVAELRRHTRVIPLRRGRDDRYVASAELGWSLFGVWERSGAQGGSTLLGYKFALCDPSSGRWEYPPDDRGLVVI